MTRAMKFTSIATAIKLALVFSHDRLALMRFRMRA